MDRDNNLALLSLYRFSSRIDEKINLKKTFVVAIAPEVKKLENFLKPEENVLNFLVMDPRNCVINGVELSSYCVQQTLRLKNN